MGDRLECSCKPSPKFNYPDEIKKLLLISPRRFRIRDQKTESCCSFWELGNSQIVAFPFQESIRDLFEAETDIRLSQWRSGSYCAKLNELTRLEALAFDKKYFRRVFIRSLLDSAVAIDILRPEPTADRTKIGEAFYRAKYKQDLSEIDRLAEAFGRFILQTPTLASADAIMPIPADAIKSFDLPHELSIRISEQSKLALAIGNRGYGGHKASLKEVSVDDKWRILTDAKPYLVLSQRYKHILLIDDFYQSGTTAHFWAAIIKQSGVRKVSI